MFNPPMSVEDATAGIARLYAIVEALTLADQTHAAKISAAERAVREARQSFPAISSDPGDRAQRIKAALNDGNFSAVAAIRAELEVTRIENARRAVDRLKAVAAAQHAVANAWADRNQEMSAIWSDGAALYRQLNAALTQTAQEGERLYVTAGRGFMAHLEADHDAKDAEAALQREINALAGIEPEPTPVTWPASVARELAQHARAG